MAITMPRPEFAAPGPGRWYRDSLHWTSPMTRWLGPIYHLTLRRGLGLSAARYGALEHYDFAAVHGVSYASPRWPGVDPHRTTGIDDVLRTGPADVPARIAASERVFRDRLWRQDIARWDGTWKPALTRALRALRAVEPAGLTDTALAEHLDRCRRTLLTSMYRHHALNHCCHVAVGDYVRRVREWTGAPTDRLTDLLGGASPASVGARAELDAVRAALADDQDAATALRSARDAAEVLDQLLASPAVGQRIRDYLEVAGLRMATGYDVSNRYPLELPRLLVTLFESGRADPNGQARDRTADLRAEVAPERRAEFDELLGEARACYRIRDERSWYGDALATGIARRALLAAGDRLVAAGRLDDRGQAVDLTHRDLVTLLRGGHVDTGQARDYARYRGATSVLSAPEVLGPAIEYPKLTWLPPGARRLAEALSDDGSSDEPAWSGAPDALPGVPASRGVAEGTARVVSSLDDLDRLAEGDILVCRATSPAYNVVLPVILAVVTAQGGPFSHAAIVAREHGIPAVVGVPGATELIPDGVRLRVDGDTGVVEVLG
ncbi:PEP-utilizing enzyme [Actinophytocola sediminis]